MKFVMTQAVCQEGMELIDGKASVYVAEDTNLQNYLEQIEDTDALIVRIGRCDASIIDRAANLKVIGRTGVGYDNVDVKKATKMGIPVVITPGANTRSVAEHAVAMMFSLSKNLYEAQREMEKGNWKIRDAGKAFELEGKKVGLIGLGAIGKETARICRGIGMSIAGYDPMLSKEEVEKYNIEYFANIDELLINSDIISIHVPLVESTKNMISMKELKMMKSSALLINCSRGGIVNEKDLRDALNNKIIGGAGLDVFSEEPLQKENDIWSCNNLILSPHSAAQTKEAVVKMATMCVEGCLSIIEGKKWPYVANPEVYKHPKWQ